VVASHHAARPAAKLGLAWRRGAAVGFPPSVGFLALVLITAGALFGRGPAVRVERAWPTISGTAVVAPFAFRGDTTLAYLGDTVDDLLAARLDWGDGLGDESGALTSTSKAGANQLPEPSAAGDGGGDTLYISGEIVAVRGLLHIRASALDARRPSEPVTGADVEGQVGDLFTLLDRLAAHLLAGQLQTPGAGLARRAFGTAATLPAAKAFLRGEDALQAGRYEDAIAAFRRAVAEDTSFALAYYRLALTAAHAGRLALADTGVAAAARYGGMLAERDRRLIDALRARRAERLDRAEEIYRSLAGADPTDVEAWWQLGEVLYHGDSTRGRRLDDARSAFSRVLALAPQHHEARSHLARIAADAGPPRE
jgi:tetratricopeptide (TPR) repeat protein